MVGDQETLFVTRILKFFLKYVTDFPPHTRRFFRFEPLPSKLKMGQHITNKETDALSEGRKMENSIIGEEIIPLPDPSL